MAVAVDKINIKDTQKSYWEKFYKVRYLDVITEDLTQQGVSFLEEYLPVSKYTTLLDFVCGFGRLSVGLAKLGHKVHGFDIDKGNIVDAISLASKNAVSKVTSFEIADALEFNSSIKYDAAFCFYTSIGFLDALSNEQVFKNFFNSVKLGGRAIVDTMNPDWALSHIKPYNKKIKNYNGDSYEVIHEREYLDNPIRELNTLRVTNLTTGATDVSQYWIQLYSLEELTQLFESNGFKVISGFGSMEKDPVSSENQRLILIGDKIS